MANKRSAERVGAGVYLGGEGDTEGGEQGVELGDVGAARATNAAEIQGGEGHNIVESHNKTKKNSNENTKNHNNSVELGDVGAAQATDTGKVRVKGALCA